MQVIIAGGTGLIGRQLTKEMVQHGYKVVIMSRDPSKMTSVPQGV